MPGGKGKSSGGKSSGGKTSAEGAQKKQMSHSERAGLQVSFMFPERRFTMIFLDFARSLCAPPLIRAAVLGSPTPKLSRNPKTPATIIAIDSSFYDALHVATTPD